MLSRDLYFDFISGEEFERYLQKLFENLHYYVELTPATGDYGADLIVHKDNKKIAVQAKRYSDKVSPKAIQEVIGAVHYYKANKGMVITNNYFTTNAIKLAQSANIELWDRTMLIKMSINALAKNTESNIQTPEELLLSASQQIWERDELFEQAACFVICQNKASYNLLQRHFRIGVNRAFRLLLELEEAKVIGLENGSNPREVIINDEDFFTLFGYKKTDINKDYNTVHGLHSPYSNTKNKSFLGAIYSALFHKTK